MSISEKAAVQMLKEMRACGTWDSATLDRAIENVSALSLHQHPASEANAKLADDLQRLCCAETEAKFFDLVTDSIGTIIAALRVTTTLSEIEQARAIQAKQVMPLIGPLLDAWDDLPNDTKGAWREECPILCSYLDRLNSAMEVDLAAAPPAPQAAPNGLENLKAILADQPYRNSALSVIEVETILENGGGFMPDEAVSWFRVVRGHLAALIAERDGTDA